MAQSEMMVYCFIKPNGKNEIGTIRNSAMYVLPYVLCICYSVETRMTDKPLFWILSMIELPTA